jgi:trehalose 6-phosphate phosphatase
MCALHKQQHDRALPVTSPPALDRQAALFLDVDGTLLDIAPHPEQVTVSPELPGLLQRLAAERGGALALISGRPIADLDRLFRPWHGAAAGLHGIERRGADGNDAPAAATDDDRVAAAALDRIRPELAALARQWPGVWLEDKGRTVALHYRAAPQAGGAVRDAAARLLQEMDDGLRLISGKMVIEFQPRRYNKGRVIVAFMAESPFRGRTPVFLGDDTTDEDGFAEINHRGGVSIRIGAHSSCDTVAAYRLPSVNAALEWLTPEDGPAG